MKHLTFTTFTLSTLALAALAGCGDDENYPADAARTIDAATANPDAPGQPAKPALGAQVDRMGRPAVNTAANHTFDPDATATQAAKNAWNTAADPTTWGAMFAAEVRANLAIYDSLDTVCGNQLVAGGAGPTRYSTLAGVLADDRLWVNTGSGTCATYLGVEANFLGITNTDCGGRAPSYDVIERTYSVLAAGTLTGIDDTITVEHNPASPVNFPFLSAPE